MSVKDGKEIIRGVVGSVAYGLATPESDIDYLGDEFSKFDKIKSDLPDKPDYEAANKLLVEIRMMNLNKQA